jgi:major intracellular serine protease
VNYPGRYRQTIAVGAVGDDQLISDFSSRGAAVDIAAPGANILSTYPGGEYVRLIHNSSSRWLVKFLVLVKRFGNEA